MKARNGKILIPKENLWVHSDSEDENSTPHQFDEWNDFFTVMKMTGDELDEDPLSGSVAGAADTLQTVKLLSKEYEAFMQWKAAQKENLKETSGLETPSKSTSQGKSKLLSESPSSQNKTSSNEDKQQ